MIDGSSLSCLQFDQEQFLEIVEHAFLFHAGHVSFCHSLSFCCQREDFFVALRYFDLDVLLVGFVAAAALPVAFEVVALFAQTDHF